MDLLTLVDRSPATKLRVDRPVNFAYISSLLDDVEQFRVTALNVGQDPFKIPASTGDIKLVDRSILAFTPYFSPVLYPRTAFSSTNYWYHLTSDYWTKILKDRQQIANAEFMRQYVERGDLGVKTGRGFYAYPEPAFAGPALSISRSGKDEVDGF